jgi:hypothetical protein
MDEHTDLSMRWYKRILWTIAQIVLTPFYSLMEAFGVLSAIVCPVQGFHVVKK